MADEVAGLTLKVIGVVRNELKGPGQYNPHEIVSEIVIDESLTDALDNLEEFSHLIVLYWMHLDAHPEPKPNKIHPRHDTSNPLVGIFSTRSGDRPNRIGLNPAKLLERKGNILRVSGLDAVDGTPVIDIKPYMPRLDTIADAQVSNWEEVYRDRRQQE